MNLRRGQPWVIKYSLFSTADNSSFSPLPFSHPEWTGCVLGCRLYHEYINWLERSKLNTALPWTINAEVEFGKLPGKAVSAKEHVKMVQHNTGVLGGEERLGCVQPSGTHNV